MTKLVVKIIMLRVLGFVFFNFFGNTEFYFATTEFSILLYNVKNVNIYKSIQRNIINMRALCLFFKLLMASAINRQQMDEIKLTNFDKKNNSYPHFRGFCLMFPHI